MENITSDSNKILSDKLALARELSSLRPEVEHLRAQVESNQGLLAEKLSLQRQLNTAQVELENEKRTAARALAKQGRKMDQDDELRSELEELRKELAKEKKDSLKAEAALAKLKQTVEKMESDLETHQQAADRALAKAKLATEKGSVKASRREEERDAEIEQLRQELAQEQSARSKAEKASKKGASRDAELEELRQELEQERLERQQLEKASKKDTQQASALPQHLKQELDEEKRERKRQEKEYTKTLAELQGRNTVLDDKLNASREKLRTTKEKLKEKEAELVRVERAQTAPPVKPARETLTKPAKTVRKRMAASVEPETNLGTPGDGFPAKKAKRGTSVSVGDTSTFSLTPFLNRTGSVAPGETILEEDEDDDQPEPLEATPTAPTKKAAKKVAELKSKPLAPSASNKANAKPRKKTPAPALEMVTEEASEISSSKDNSENLPITIPLKPADDGQPKPKSLKAKPRKSLMSFATFTEEPAAEKKKKRKLGASTAGGGLGKTLFDADEEEDAPPKPIASKGIFAARALGKSMVGKGPQRPISGGYNMMSEEGFSFSPLKKDRRGASILK